MIRDHAVLDQILGTINQFVTERLRPLEDQVAAEDQIPESVVAAMRDMGLLGMTIPEEYGGLGMTAEEVIDMYNATPAPDTYACLYPENITRLIADVNGDCRVTLDDILVVVEKWLDCGRYPAGSCNW